MSAPEGNEFWKLRSKHGRKKLFNSPKLFLQAAYEYFQWCDSHPWYKQEQLKKPYQTGRGKNKKWVMIAEIPTQRPYTLSGLSIYCDASESWLREFEKALVKKGEDKQAQDFLRIIAHVKEIIADQQLQGATVGAFNANIIARKLGLTEKIEAKNENRNYNYNSVDLKPDEIKQIGQALEDEY